jgi:hypothetical protein
MLKDKIGEKQKPIFILKNQVNLSQPTKLSMQVMHTIGFNKILFHELVSI